MHAVQLSEIHKHASAMSQPQDNSPLQPTLRSTQINAAECAPTIYMYTATFKSKNALMIQEPAKICMVFKSRLYLYSSGLKEANEPSVSSLGHLGLHGESGLVSQHRSQGLIASRAIVASRGLLRFAF